jgi:hypothetical protein
MIEARTCRVLDIFTGREKVGVTFLSSAAAPNQPYVAIELHNNSTPTHGLRLEQVPAYTPAASQFSVINEQLLQHSSFPDSRPRCAEVFEKSTLDALNGIPNNA